VTGAAALVFFGLEVARASAHFGLEPPKVTAICLHERNPLASSLVVAYVEPVVIPGSKPEVKIMWHALWSKNKKTLRCIARHEVTHIALGQAGGARDQAEHDAFEDQVDGVLARTWREPLHCGLR
jgi:hypothetical protein